MFNVQTLLEKEFSKQGFNEENINNLIMLGADIHKPVNNNGDYLLHSLVWCIFKYNNNDLDTKFNYLVDNKGILNRCNKKNETPFELICGGCTKNYYEKHKIISKLLMLGVLHNNFYINRILNVCSILEEEVPYGSHYLCRSNDDICSSVYTYIKYSHQIWSIYNHHNTAPSVRNAVWIMCLIRNRIIEQDLLHYHLPVELWLLICSFFNRRMWLTLEGCRINEQFTKVSNLPCSL